MRVAAAVAGALIVAVASNSAQAFIIRPLYDFDAWSPQQRAVIQRAITDWTSRIAFPSPDNQVVEINFQFFSGGTGPGSSLAQWTFSPRNVPQFPDSPAITHFISVNSDVLDRMWFSLQAPGPSDGYDMLSIMRHELGHALGFVPHVYFTPFPGVDKWESHIENNIFDPGGLSVPMFADGAHMNVPSDLMYFSLASGVRKEISERDVQMMSLAFGYTAIPEPSSLLLLLAGAATLLKRPVVRRR